MQVTEIKIGISSEINTNEEALRMGPQEDIARIVEIADLDVEVILTVDDCRHLHEVAASFACEELSVEEAERLLLAFPPPGVGQWRELPRGQAAAEEVAALATVLRVGTSEFSASTEQPSHGVAALADVASPVDW